MSNKLYEIIAKTFQISESEINDESNPETIDSWDSFHALALFNTLEEEFSIQFSLIELTETKNVGDIKKNLSKHGIEI
tara:strand:- start:2875 stop:3108 length:234 start_codon:yes stop_codon:yes gene_type:complete